MGEDAAVCVMGVLSCSSLQVGNPPAWHSYACLPAGHALADQLELSEQAVPTHPDSKSQPPVHGPSGTANLPGHTPPLETCAPMVSCALTNTIGILCRFRAAGAPPRTRRVLSLLSLARPPRPCDS
ncbi:hypothetical protein BV20DRAFT_454192 [Pilatotrama ljubarskyi]|nr:hypothetical protein BV20DRAFT_454192 [Pilatotrama ljubarskyi]